MRTIVLIALGLAFAALFAVLGRFADKHTTLSINGAFIFIVCWTAFTFGDFFVSIFQPGHAPLPEFGKHVAIFVGPVAAALFATRKSLQGGLRTAPAARPPATGGSRPEGAPAAAPGNRPAQVAPEAPASREDGRPRRSGTAGR